MQCSTHLLQLKEMLWCCCLKPDISNYKEVHELKIDEPVFQKLNASEYFIHLVDSSVTDYDKCCFRDQYRDRIQSPNEHVITYYYSKLTLFLRAFPARERSLERFKLDVLDGVYNTELIDWTARSNYAQISSMKMRLRQPWKIFFLSLKGITRTQETQIPTWQDWTEANMEHRIFQWQERKPLLRRMM